MKLNCRSRSVILAVGVGVRDTWRGEGWGEGGRACMHDYTYVQCRPTIGMICDIIQP